MIDYDCVRQVLERLAGTLVQQYDLKEVIEHVAEDITRIVGVAGAGVMLEVEKDELRFFSTSDETLGHLEDLQIQLDEGPCLYAYRASETVIAADLTSDERFPEFGPRAVDVGMAAVYSFPMRLEETCIGALNLYSDQPGEFDDDQVRICQTLADVATIYLLHAEEMERREQLSEQLQHALSSRVMIEQAKGFIVSARGIDADAAFDKLRGYARKRGLPLREVAEDVVSRKLEVDELDLRSPRS